MDVVPSARTPVPPTPGDALRVNAALGPAAVRTELPPQATVQQATAPEKPGNGDGLPAAGKAAELTHRVTVDAATQALVFQKIRPETGEVVRQVPDQAILRMRAYARGLDQDGSGPSDLDARV